MFYNNVRTGQANPEEADRYIWGPSAQITKDNIDIQNEDASKSRLDILDVRKVLK